MTDEQFNQLLSILGTVGTEAYRVAIQRAYSEGTLSVVIFVMGVILLVFISKKLRHQLLPPKEHYDDITVCVLSWITVVIVAIITLYHFCNGWLILGSVDFWAIHLLSQLVK